MHSHLYTDSACLSISSDVQFSFRRVLSLVILHSPTVHPVPAKASAIASDSVFSTVSNRTNVLPSNVSTSSCARTSAVPSEDGLISLTTNLSVSVSIYPSFSRFAISPISALNSNVLSSNCNLLVIRSCLYRSRPCTGSLFLLSMRSIQIITPY